MTLPEFEMAIGDLIKHCRANLDQAQMRIMWERLQGIPIKCLQWASDQMIGELKQTKGAFPTIAQLKNRAMDYWKMHPGDELADKTYDAYEDLDYPMQYLYNAYRILIDVGPKMCINYCEAHKMPLQDQIRVLNKGRVSHHIEGLADMIIDLEERVAIGQGRKPSDTGYQADTQRIGDISLESAARHGMRSWSPGHHRDMATTSGRHPQTGHSDWN